MKRRFRILALFLFALTQSIAPLVHAHVDGIQGDTSFHTHDLPHLLFLPTELSQSYVETYESPAISIPHEYQRDDAFVILDIFTLSAYPSAPSIIAYATKPHDSQHFIGYAYHRPHPQAPPYWA